MSFRLLHTAADCSARLGVLETDHGAIHTPIFMPVGTAATVKAVMPHALKQDIKAEIILANTYHLHLRPTKEIIEKAGGLHEFMNWNLPILTDSGGYQVYSLSQRRKISQEGALFYSHIDGSKHFFTPESVIQLQRSLGSDIIMAFDECPPHPCTYEYAKKSLLLTQQWWKRCWSEFQNSSPRYQHKQKLFPIVQGSTFSDLRKQAVAELSNYTGLEGIAIGGLSVGEPKNLMYEMTALNCEELPKDLPRYLMGVGTPEDILEGIALGVDMFDCVMPTRNGRNGMIFTTQGILNIKNARWKDDFSPLDSGLTKSFVSQEFSKAYVRHLFQCKENLGLQIASIQNLTLYLWLIRQARQHIQNETFAAWKTQIIPQLMQRIS